MRGTPRRTLVSHLPAVAVALLLSSCSVARAYVAVLQGNGAYERGSYQRATVHYLDAQKGRTHPARVAYDLGNVYHALGEPEGAQLEWAKAVKSHDRRVLVDALFNEGILEYELGRYREAYDHFRRVLELTPGDIEAKIDLELSFDKMTTRKVPPAAAQTAPAAVKHSNRQANQLLDIIRRDQKGYFTPPPPAPPSPGVANW